MLRDRYQASQSQVNLDQLASEVNATSYKLEDVDDLTPLIDQIGDARYVLLGEASHGTSEFYRWRAYLSRRLIREKGFSFIAVEGDWPDCYKVNRYIKGYPQSGADAHSLLHTFSRWPTWMWANWEVVALTEWLRKENEGLPPSERVGFYGLDVYSLHESMGVLGEYIEKNRPDALEAMHRAMRCFEPYREDPQAYAWSTALVPTSCENEVLSLLMKLREQSYPYTSDPEAGFNAEQNSWVTVGAERYYRTMMKGDAESWNIRDLHMADTLDRIMDYHGPQAKAIVWEHNTHVGDARATDMAQVQMLNVGQVTRERHGEEGVYVVGFGSHHGTVIAAEEWGAPIQQMEVPPARRGSWEDIFHQGRQQNALALMDEMRQVEGATQLRGHRAIGVVYHPDAEAGNYVPTILPARYDAFLFFDETQALHPLHLQGEMCEVPETYPWGV